MFRRDTPTAGVNAPVFGVFFAALFAAAAALPTQAQFTVRAADSAFAPHFLRIGTEKIANTFIFTGAADVVIPLSVGTFALKQEYRGTAIRSGNAAFRDDEQLSVQFTMPLPDTAFALTARGFWLLSKDSRDIGLSSLSQAGGTLGARWKPAANIETDISAGADQTVQLGRASAASIFGVSGVARQVDLGEVTGDFSLRSGYSRLDAGRVNADLDVSAAVERLSDGGGIARFSARQRLLGRDYFLPVGSDGSLGVESRTEHRTELAGDILQPVIDNVLQAEARAELGSVEVGRSFFAAVAGTPLTAVARELSEFTLNFTGALRLSLPDLQLYGGASFALRDEANGIDPKFEVLPGEVAQIKLSEFQRDNSSTRTRLFAQAQWNTSPDDTFRLAASGAILHYDTPSDLNYDDRDELLLNASAEAGRRFAPGLSAAAGFSAQMLHTVFIKSQRSSLNNWNRILKVFTRAAITGGSVELRPVFEVLANYTVYDFESVGGTRSFSFRQVSVRDSVIVHIGRELHAEGRLFARYFLTGQLDWQNFTETPLNSNYEQFLKILIFTRPAPNVSLGVGGRYYALSQQAAGASVLPGGVGSSLQQFYGPETVIDVRFSGGTRLLMNGWYERQFVNRALLRNLPNLFLTVTTPL